MNVQPVNEIKLMSHTNCVLALCVKLRCWTASLFTKPPTLRAKCKNILLRSLLPLLLSGLGAAMPTHPAVTQTPVNAVAAGTAVNYMVIAAGVPLGGSVTIDVVNNGININDQITSSCGVPDGLFYCDDSGSYSLDWMPPAGVNNLAFTVTVYDGSGIPSNPIMENLTTVVGSESLQLQVSVDPTIYTGVGDVVTYTYQIINSGSLDLGSISLTDSRLGSISGCGIRSLAAGASISCNQAYSITQADLDAVKVRPVLS